MTNYLRDMIIYIIFYEHEHALFKCIQLCVQRSLSAKNMTHAKGGLILAAYLKITSFFFFIIPGLIARALFPGTVNKECNNYYLAIEILS